MEPMNEQRTRSEAKWQIWAGTIVFVGIAATIAFAFVESWVG
jgi:hypothetical protein